MTMAAADTRSPEEQIEIILRSFRCFHFAIAGLIPLLGLPFSIMAMVMGARLRSRLAKQWNPAKYHLDWGMSVAAFGILIHFLAALGLYATVLENFWRGHGW